jgi:hypothetical protein
LKRPLLIVTALTISGVACLWLWHRAFDHDLIKDQLLVRAANAGDLGAVRRLLQQQADPNALSLPSSSIQWWKQALNPMDGRLSALTLASNRGATAVVEELIARGADPNIRDNIGSTPLMWAVSHRQPSPDQIKTIQILLRHRANVNIANERGTTALMSAASYAPAELVTMLLAHGAEAEQRDNRGHTALWWARTTKNDRAVKYLDNARHKTVQ